MRRIIDLMETAPFAHDLEVDDGRATLRLSGELDLTTIEAMKAALRSLRGDGAPLVVDLTALEFAGVRGTRALAAELAALRTVRPVCVVNVPRRVRKVAKLLRVADDIGT